MGVPSHAASLAPPRSLDLTMMREAERDAFELGIVAATLEQPGDVMRLDPIRAAAHRARATHLRQGGPAERARLTA